MGEATPATTTATCFWCGTSASEAELFIVHNDPSGVCDRCVGYLMSVLAIDIRPLFERYVDKARGYSDSSEAARRDREAAKRLI